MGDVMSIELVFEASYTIKKLRSGPLGNILDEFCERLLERGYSRGTIRLLLSHVSHLNQYLESQNIGKDDVLSESDINKFFKEYPRYSRNRGPLDKHIRRLRFSINRFVQYLQQLGRFDSQDEPPVFATILEDYLRWMHDERHVTMGTLEVRRHSISEFLKWLGPKAIDQGLAELTPEVIEQFFLSYAETSGPSARRSMQAALRTFLRFCLQKGLIQHPLDRAVPTLHTYKLATVPRGLSHKQAQKLLDSVNRKTPVGRRDYAILQLLYAYGVRGGQVRALQLADIQCPKAGRLGVASGGVMMNAINLNSPLATRIQSLIKLRQLCGRDYRSQGKLLEYFDRFLVQEKVKQPRITRQIIERYQRTLSHLTPRGQANRFCVVRQLCEYLARHDRNTFIPEPMRMLSLYAARKPYIYSASELQSLLNAALKLPPAGSLRPHTYHTLIGLLYSTGIRISEACSLNLESFHMSQQCLYIATIYAPLIQREVYHDSSTRTFHEAILQSLSICAKRPFHQYHQHLPRCDQVATLL